MRVGVLGWLQESNTFAPGATTISDYENDLLITGSQIHSTFADGHHEISGFLRGLQREGIEPAPVFVARAIPCGTMTSATFESLLSKLVTELQQAMPLDGVLAAAHGATVSECNLDVDGAWLSAVRDVVGEQVPVVATLDLHANLSTEMVDACDALVAYRTNPHLDQCDRGEEAAEILARTLRSEIQLTMAAAMVPLAINIENQNSSSFPCSEIFGYANEISGKAGVISSSVLLGFPYADVPEMGASAIILTDNDQELASTSVAKLGDLIWHHRDALSTMPLSIRDAIAQAMTAEGPVCLLDIGDNVGGGSPGDSTHLVHALLASNARSVLACLHDPEVVRQVANLEVGQTAHLHVGGKYCSLSGRPIEGQFRVQGFYDGKFSESRPRHGGFTTFDQGPSVVLESNDGLTLLVHSLRVPPFSLAQITSCRIDPKDYQIIVAKGVHAPIAAYREVCVECIRTNTPGVTTANIALLAYEHRRRPMYPYERSCTWTANLGAPQ